MNIKQKFLNWIKPKILSLAIKIIFKYIDVWSDMRMEMRPDRTNKLDLTITGRNGVTTYKIFDIINKNMR